MKRIERVKKEGIRIEFKDIDQAMEVLLHNCYSIEIRKSQTGGMFAIYQTFDAWGKTVKDALELLANRMAAEGKLDF